MKYLVSDLQGGQLDAAVAKAQGRKFVLVRTMMDEPGPYKCRVSPGSEVFAPSSDWAHGGPIIEREGIETWKWRGSDGVYWVANVGGRKLSVVENRFPAPHAIGATALIAAMRAFVIARLGDEVDL